MADPWTFFASMQAWRASSLKKRPFGSRTESRWRADATGIRHCYVLARINQFGAES
jgi:hypothetical protein